MKSYIKKTLWIAGCIFLFACSVQPVEELQKKDRAVLSLAQEYILKNRIEKAAAFLDKIDASEKQTAEFYRLRSLYLLKANRLEDAEEYHKKSIKKFPQDVFLLNNYGVLLVRLGDYAKACELFEKTLKISRNRSQSGLINYSRCLISKDDVKKASILIDQAKELGNLPYIGLLTELNLVLIQGNKFKASQINKIIQANTNYAQISEYKKEYECLSRHINASETDLTSSFLHSPSACIVPRYKT